MTSSTRTPIATVTLITACIGTAFAVLWVPSIVEVLGFDEAKPSLLSAFSSLFVHQNLIHLLGNMVFLAAVGPAVELAAGTVRFIAIFLLGGLVGVAAHLIVGPRIGGMPPLVGASGSIAACIAYYSLRYFNLRVAVFTGLGVPLLAVVGVWVGLQLLGGFVTIGEASPVSYWAHLGGFSVGLIAGLVFGAPNLAQVELGHEALDRMNHRGPDAKLQAANHHLSQHPGDIRALREKADALQQLGEADMEVSVLVSLLDNLPESEQGPPLQRLVEMGRCMVLPSLRRSLLADHLKMSDPDLARRLLDSVVSGPADDPQRPDALLALVALERESNEDRANDLCQELVDIYPMHPATELARRRGWIA